MTPRRFRIVLAAAVFFAIVTPIIPAWPARRSSRSMCGAGASAARSPIAASRRWPLRCN